MKRLEVTVLHHQRFAVLFEKEPHLRPGGRVSEQERVLHDLVEVEELDRLQRPPDFLPASRQVRTIQDVHQGPFQTRDPQLHTGALCGRNADMHFSSRGGEPVETASPENMGAERQMDRAGGTPST
ncbi:MAG: hypothetical protein MZV70_16615 [Desulfobacterales bacterium]|nr:hypothetical protein [Desulfobacterales bacterium]